MGYLRSLAIAIWLSIISALRLPVNPFGELSLLACPVPRYSRPTAMQATLSPKTGEKAVPDQNDVRWPFGMLRNYSLLSVNAVDERRPTN